MARYLVNTARTLIFSTGPAPPVVAAALAALELRAREPAPDRARAPQRPDAARRARRQASPSRPARRAIVPLVVGDAARAVARLRAGAAAGRVRAGDPAARPCRRAARGCAWRRWRATTRPSSSGRRRSSARPYARPARDPAARRAQRSAILFDHARAALAPQRLAGCSSPAPTPRSARRSSRARSRPRWPRAGERVSVFKPVGDRPRGDRGTGRPTTSACAPPRARRRAPPDVAPYRFGPPVSPHLAAERGRASGRAPRAAAQRRTARRRAGDVLVAEGVGGLLVPLARGYLVRDLAADLGAAGRDRGAARASGRSATR